MHSSRMRTSRLLTVFRSLQPGGVYLVPGGCTWSGGVYLVQGGCTWSQGGVPGPGGCTWSWGVYLVQGGGYLVLGGVPGPGGVYLVPGGVPGTWSGTPAPPVNRMTNRCKNITLAKTSFRPVMIPE